MDCLLARAIVETASLQSNSIKKDMWQWDGVIFPVLAYGNHCIRLDIVHAQP